MRTGGEQLARKRYVTVMLRLLVDQHGCLMQGEIVSVEVSHLQQRFVGWRGLVRALQALLESTLHGRYDSYDGPDSPGRPDSGGSLDEAPKDP